jgi:hypothetical protein
MNARPTRNGKVPAPPERPVVSVSRNSSREGSTSAYATSRPSTPIVDGAGKVGASLRVVTTWSGPALVDVGRINAESGLCARGAIARGAGPVGRASSPSFALKSIVSTTP